MGQPATAVYDFNAGYMLLQQLAVGHDKVSAAIALRDKQRSDKLGDPNLGSSWQGNRRDRFEKDFSPQQHELSALGDVLLRLISAVTDANSAAQAFNTAHAKK